MRPKATHLYGACSQGADDRRRDYHHGRPAGREPMPLVPGGPVLATGFGIRSAIVKRWRHINRRAAAQQAGRRTVAQRQTRKNGIQWQWVGPTCTLSIQTPAVGFSTEQ